jgi:hypothetical protein
VQLVMTGCHSQFQKVLKVLTSENDLQVLDSLHVPEWQLVHQQSYALVEEFQYEENNLIAQPKWHSYKTTKSWFNASVQVKSTNRLADFG